MTRKNWKKKTSNTYLSDMNTENVKTETFLKKKRSLNDNRNVLQNENKLWE